MRPPRARRELGEGLASVAALQHDPVLRPGGGGPGHGCPDRGPSLSRGSGQYLLGRPAKETE